MEGVGRAETVYGSVADLADDLRDRRTTPDIKTAMPKNTITRT